MNPKEPKTFNFQVRKKCKNALEKLEDGVTTKGVDINTLQTARMSQENSQRTVTGHVDHIPLPGGGVRDVYNVIENAITERREIEMQTIVKQQHIINQQQEKIDQQSGDIHDLCIAFQDQNWMMSLMSRDESELQGEDLYDMRYCKRQLEDVCQPLRDRIAELEKQLSEYKRRYADLQNSLDAPVRFRSIARAWKLTRKCGIPTMSILPSGTRSSKTFGRYRNARELSTTFTEHGVAILKMVYALASILYLWEF